MLVSNVPDEFTINCCWAFFNLTVRIGNSCYGSGPIHEGSSLYDSPGIHASGTESLGYPFYSGIFELALQIFTPIHNMTDTTPYPVRAWYLCSDGHTGLRTVYVHPNTENNSVNIVVNRAIFPVDADISNMQVAVDGGFYHVVFDRERHQRDRLNGTYLFVRLLNRGQAIDLWPEEVMMDLIKVLDEYVRCPSA